MMGRLPELRRHKRVRFGHDAHRLEAGALAEGGRSDSSISKRLRFGLNRMLNQYAPFAS
jgi:hypothetical protein